MDFSNLIYIVLYFTVFFTILLYIVLVYNRQNIIDNWDKYKCNPLVIPFSGFFGKNSSDALNTCLLSNFTTLFSTLFRPFTLLTTLVSSVLTEMIHQVNVIRYILKPIRLFIEQITGMMYKKIESIVHLSYMSYLKMDNLTRRVLANFRLLVYSLEASQFALQSSFNGPIMDIAKFWAPSADYFSKQFCFSEYSRLPLYKDGFRYIKDIKIGDKLLDKNRVLGYCIFKASDKLVNNNGIYVSKYHIEIRDNIYKLCDNYQESNIEFNNIYCLITSNNKIAIYNSNNCIQYFTDYLETSDNYFQFKIRKLLYENLGLDTPKNTAPNLLTPNTPILLNSNKYISIDKLKIGDRLYDNNEVIGIITQTSNEIVYNNYFSPSIINLDMMCDYNTKNKTSSFYSGIMYNIVTRNGFFIVDGMRIVDYNFLAGEKLVDRIRELTLNYLNNKK
jgi:hypothetical protein